MQIDVKIKKTSGSLARVITGLRRKGFAFRRHRISDDADPGCSRLTIDIDDGDASQQEVFTALTEIQGVVQVVEIRAEEPAATAPENPQPASVPAPASNSPSSSPAIIKLVESYPKIMPLIEEIEATLKNAKNRDRKLHMLGEQMGTALASREPGTAIAGEETRKEVLESIVKLLAPIANMQVQGDDLVARVSLFTRRYLNNVELLFGAEPEKCNFLCGLIQGLARSNSGLRNVVVTEPECRGNGDFQCRFALKNKS
jgi:predicted hydrocarbon binding protein